MVAFGGKEKGKIGSEESGGESKGFSKGLEDAELGRGGYVRIRVSRGLTLSDFELSIADDNGVTGVDDLQPAKEVTKLGDGRSQTR